MAKKTIRHEQEYFEIEYPDFFENDMRELRASESKKEKMEIFSRMLKSAKAFRSQLDIEYNSILNQIIELDQRAQSVSNKSYEVKKFMDRINYIGEKTETIF
jgi:hypothetical protein